MSKQFLAVIAAVVLIFVAIFAFSGNKSSNTSNKNSSKAAPTQHITGQGKSGVTLVEYGDYQCPYCEQYYPTVKQAVTEFSDQIHFQFRNFPLVNAHQNAFAGARAAEAAALQNKFWEMHDTLYEPSNWQQWTVSNGPSTYFEQYAKQLGLNVTQFKADYASGKINDTINADMAEGNKLGVSGTPSFFLDGKQVQINNDITSFEKVINAEIAKKAPATTAPSSTQ